MHMERGRKEIKREKEGEVGVQEGGKARERASVYARVGRKGVKSIRSEKEKV